MTTRSGLVAAFIIGVAVVVAFTPGAGATVEMQNQAKELGFPLKNCIYCHASPHAVDKMKEIAPDVGVSPGNCVACHGAEIPWSLNDRGEWLVAEKERRQADEFDMAWLTDYEEPAAEEEPEPDSPPE